LSARPAEDARHADIRFQDEKPGYDGFSPATQAPRQDLKMGLDAYKEPVYTISVAADLLEMHPQTLRMYERKGLIEPGRTETQQRLYSLQDLDDVREIRHLTREKGVNLAGVKIILEQKRSIEELRERVATLETRLEQGNNTPGT